MMRRERPDGAANAGARGKPIEPNARDSAAAVSESEGEAVDVLQPVLVWRVQLSGRHHGHAHSPGQGIGFLHERARAQRDSERGSNEHGVRLLAELR